VCLCLSINKALATFQSESEMITQVTKLIDTEESKIRRFSSDTLDGGEEICISQERI
jgi:hypothetical protein